MNKEFMVKMLQAKQLEYEALKEIMPECMVKRVNKLGEELLEVTMDYFKAAYQKAEDEKSDSEDGAKSRVNKITIE
jgi:hypothetical protein